MVLDRVFTEERPTLIAVSLLSKYFEGRAFSSLEKFWELAKIGRNKGKSFILENCIGGEAPLQKADLTEVALCVTMPRHIGNSEYAGSNPVFRSICCTAA